ncbi:hypothetical protein [Domibacillus indicus]|uniref:hypothetical protein n=1 Tax=Domibacillus indicus TaxID=1437523 RepID=UPI0028899D06|nr:hypothetical protein [Domibacillus indicus]
MVFCREWLQVKDGEMYALRLSEDFQAVHGEPVLLFTASQAPWTKPVREANYITDGPFLYETENGELEMIWSSYSEKAMQSVLPGPYQELLRDRGFMRQNRCLIKTAAME